MSGVLASGPPILALPQQPQCTTMGSNAIYIVDCIQQRNGPQAQEDAWKSQAPKDALL